MISKIGPKNTTTIWSESVETGAPLDRYEEVSSPLLALGGGPHPAHWIPYLQSEDVELRREGVFALARYRSEAKIAVHDLAKLLEDEDGEVRRGAALALSNIGPEVWPAVQALMKAMKDEIPEVRANAARALGNIGYTLWPTVDALIPAFRDNNRDVRWNAIEAVGKIGPGARKAVLDLMLILQEEERHPKISQRETRLQIIEALGNMGQSAIPAISMLEWIVDHDPYSTCREVAQQALDKLRESIR